MLENVSCVTTVSDRFFINDTACHCLIIPLCHSSPPSLLLLLGLAGCLHACVIVWHRWVTWGYNIKTQEGGGGAKCTLSAVSGAAVKSTYRGTDRQVVSDKTAAVYTGEKLKLKYQSHYTHTHHCLACYCCSRVMFLVSIKCPDTNCNIHYRNKIFFKLNQYQYQHWY